MEAVKLAGLEPASVFGYFEKISSIPHGSRNTKAISDYLVSFAVEQGLRYIQDSLNNVIIFADGTEGFEDHEGVERDQIDENELQRKEDVVDLRIQRGDRIREEAPDEGDRAQRRREEIKRAEHKRQNNEFQHREDRKEDILTVMRRAVLQGGSDRQPFQFPGERDEGVRKDEQDAERHEDLNCRYQCVSRPFLGNSRSMVSTEKMR